MSLHAFFGDDAPARNLIDVDAALDATVAILKDRRSMISVDEVQYHDMLNHPVETLMKLNWPINIKEAARIPQKRHARYVIEGNEATPPAS